MMYGQRNIKLLKKHSPFKKDVQEVPHMLCHWRGEWVSARNEAELERPEKQKDFIAVSKPSRSVGLWFRKGDPYKCPFHQIPPSRSTWWL